MKLFLIFFFCTILMAPCSKFALSQPIVYSIGAQNLCENCPTGLVCHGVSPIPPVQGFCVDSCSNCLTSQFCQLCIDQSTSFPICVTVGKGSCNENRDCCGSSTTSTVCSFGVCQIVSGQYCWKNSDCVRGLNCYRNTCQVSGNGTSTPVIFPSLPDCMRRWKTTEKKIAYYQVENYNIIQYILTSLGNVFPAAGTITLSNTSSFAAELERNGISISDQQISPSSDIPAPADELESSLTKIPEQVCNQELRKTQNQLSIVKNEHNLLLRILYVVINRSQSTATADAPLEGISRQHQSQENLYGAKKSSPTAPNVSTFNSEGTNVDGLMDILNVLQEQQNGSIFAENDANILQGLAAGFVVNMPTSPLDERAGAYDDKKDGEYDKGAHDKSTQLEQDLPDKKDTQNYAAASVKNTILADENRHIKQGLPVDDNAHDKQDVVGEDALNDYNTAVAVAIQKATETPNNVLNKQG